MKQIGILLLLVGTFTVAQAQTWVNGYTRQGGTYVEGHMRIAAVVIEVPLAAVF